MQMVISPDLALDFPGLGDSRQVTCSHHHGPVDRQSRLHVLLRTELTHFLSISEMLEKVLGLSHPPPCRQRRGTLRMKQEMIKGPNEGYLSLNSVLASMNLGAD